MKRTYIHSLFIYFLLFVSNQLFSAQPEIAPTLDANQDVAAVQPIEQPAPSVMEQPVEQPVDVQAVAPAVALDPTTQATVQQLQNVSENPDISQQISTIQAAAQQAASAPADPVVQEAIGQAIVKITPKCPRQLAHELLAPLLADIRASKVAVTPEAQAHIDNILLPSIALQDQVAAQPAEIQQQDITKQLIDLKTLPDYNQQVDKLESLIEQANAQQAAGNPVDATTQALFNQNLKELAISYPTDTASIDNLNGLLQKAQGDSLFTPETQTLIQTQLIPQIEKSRATAVAQEQVQAAAPTETILAQQPSPDLMAKLKGIEQITDPNERLTAFDALMKELSGQELNQASKQEIAKQLYDLYETTPLDPQVLANLASVANEVKTYQLVNVPAQQYIQATLLPNISQEQQSAQFGQELNNAMTQSPTTARIAAVSNLTDRYLSAQMPNTTKNFYAQALLTLFNERYATQVIVEEKPAITQEEAQAPQAAVAKKKGAKAKKKVKKAQKKTTQTGKKTQAKKAKVRKVTKQVKKKKKKKKVAQQQNIKAGVQQ